MAGLSEAQTQMMTFHGSFVKLLYMQLCDRARRCGILAYSTLSSDEQRKQMRRFHGKVFLSKGVSCNATTERGDELYLSYCSLPSDEARTQMMTFHGKDFRQKRYYTTQTKISRTGSTGVRPVREIECTAAECRFSQKNTIPSTTPPRSPSVRRGRWRRRSYL